MKILSTLLFIISFSVQAFHTDLAVGFSMSNIDFKDKANDVHYTSVGITSFGVEALARLGFGDKLHFGASGYYGGSNLDLLYQATNSNSKGQDASTKYWGAGGYIGYVFTDKFSLSIDYYPMARTTISWAESKSSSVISKDDYLEGPAYGLSLKYKKSAIFFMLAIRQNTVAKGKLNGISYNDLPNESFGDFDNSQVSISAGVSI